MSLILLTLILTFVAPITLWLSIMFGAYYLAERKNRCGVTWFIITLFFPAFIILLACLDDI